MDLGKAGLVNCLRAPNEDKPGRRWQEIREYAMLSRSLLELAARRYDHVNPSPNTVTAP